MTLRATLFDMDGLLLDSEILWHKAEVEIFGSLGVPLSDAMGRSTKGMYVNEVVQYWYSQYPWPGPSESDVVRHVAREGGRFGGKRGSASSRRRARARSHR